jgi:hypothetical protein
MQVADFVKGGQLVAVEVADLPPLDRIAALVRRASAAPLSSAAEALVGTIRERAASLGLAESGASSPTLAHRERGLGGEGTSGTR